LFYEKIKSIYKNLKKWPFTSLIHHGSQAGFVPDLKNPSYATVQIQKIT